MGLTPGNPVLGGDVLRRAAIVSPDFDEANPLASPTPSWGILQSGLAYFFGLILSGGTIEGPDYIINSSGAFFYSGTPAAGNLIASIASTGGTDAHGNPYEAGVAAYVNIASGTGAGTYAVLLADQAAPYGNNAALSIQNLTNPANVPPAFVVNIDTTDGNVTELHSGKKTSAAIQSSLQLNDSLLTGRASATINADYTDDQPVANAATVREINGSLILDSLTTAASQSLNGNTSYTDTFGFLRAIAGLSGDVDHYQTAFKHVFMPTPLKITMTGQTQLTNLAVNLGISQYAFRAHIRFTGDAANAAFITMAGSAGNSFFQADITYNGPGQGVVKEQTVLGTNTGLNSAALVVNDFYTCDIEGLITVNAHGTLVVNGAASANADTFQCLTGSYLMVWPANA